MIKNAEVFLQPCLDACPTPLHLFQTFLCCPPQSTRTLASLLLSGKSEDQDRDPLISKTPVAPAPGWGGGGEGVLREVPARCPSWQPLGCAHSPKMQRPRPLNPRQLVAVPF